MSDNKVLQKGDNTFKLHRSGDKSDPGFSIVGKRLYWVYSHQQENDPGRVWAVLRKQDMPKELVDHLERKNPSIFKNGNTLTRGDLTLAYCSLDAYHELRKEKKQLADDQLSRVKTIQNDSTNNTRSRLSVFESRLEHGGAEQFRNQE